MFSLDTVANETIKNGFFANLGSDPIHVRGSRDFHREVSLAVATSGHGCNHSLGERAICLQQIGIASYSGWQYTGVVLTSHGFARINPGSGQQRLLVLHWNDVSSVDDTGDMFLHAGGKAFCGDKRMIRLIRACLGTDSQPDVNGPPYAATEADPAGVIRAHQALAGTDAAAEALLGFVQRGSARRMFGTDVARDLAARIVLWSRTNESGQGVADGHFSTCLSVHDLHYALSTLLGRSTATANQPDETVLTFRVPEALNEASRLPFRGIASGLLNGTRETKEMRVHIRSMGSATGFQASGSTPHDGFAPLTRWNPTLLVKLFSHLRGVERQLLSRRVLYGWNTAPHQLAAVPEARVLQELSRPH